MAHDGMRQLDQMLVMCMEPVAACLALGEALKWKPNDKYLVRLVRSKLPSRDFTAGATEKASTQELHACKGLGSSFAVLCGFQMYIMQTAGFADDRRVPVQGSFIFAWHIDIRCRSLKHYLSGFWLVVV